ncbi:uncharacterized protein [Hoplias malabaricus]|uniref:uncharacterized protein n=1 Tax=Hoplias malabaricus TaxID=27720 RepID=UPI003461E6A9
MELRSQCPDYIHRLKLEYEELMKEADLLERHHGGLAKMTTHVWNSHIPAGGCYCRYQLINTCVLDSLLYVLRSAHSKHKCIQELFRCDRTMSAIMIFLYAEKYDQAKVLWLIQLNLLSENCRFFMSEEVDVWSEVEDHLPVFNDMVLARHHYDEGRQSPDISESLYHNTLSVFECYGDVKILGLNCTDFCLILVHVNGRMGTAPQSHITDVYGRTYELEFLLLSDNTEPINHMVGCSETVAGWVLYDDNPEKTPMNEFNMENADFLDHLVIHLSGYVNTSKSHQGGGNGGHLQEYVPFGVPEEGSQVGTSPFNMPTRSSSPTRPVKLKKD